MKAKTWLYTTCATSPLCSIAFRDESFCQAAYLPLLIEPNENHQGENDQARGFKLTSFHDAFLCL
jgi:hypothetical protein